MKKNKTKSILACAVLASVLGVGVCLPNSAEANTTTYRYYWNGSGWTTGSGYDIPSSVIPTGANVDTLPSPSGSDPSGSDIIYDIYVGCSSSGDVTGNITTITSNKEYTISLYLHGGYSYSGGDAKNNSVTIGESILDEVNFIYGGFSFDGAATNNTVTFNGTTCKSRNYFYGGYSSTGAVTGNTVTISGGTSTSPTFSSTANIYGGRSDGAGIVGGDTAGMGNKVTISDGTFVSTANIYGGYNSSGSGDVKGNEVEISGGTSTSPTFSGTTNIYGGYSNTGAVTGNTVTISGGTSTSPTFSGTANIYGGRSDGSGIVGGDTAAKGNKVTISGGTFSGTINIYGGFFNSGSVKNNIVTINGGTFTGTTNIYGGNKSGTGNTLNLSMNLGANTVADFQKFVFTVPTGSSTILTVANTVSIDGVAVDVYLNGYTGENTITLINNVGTGTLGTTNVYTGTEGETENKNYEIALVKVDDTVNKLVLQYGVPWYSINGTVTKRSSSAAAMSLNDTSGKAVVLYRGAGGNNEYTGIDITGALTVGAETTTGTSFLVSGDLTAGKGVTVATKNTLNVAANNLKSTVVNSGTVNLGAGTLATGKKISGGTLNINDDVTVANAEDIAGTTNTIANGKKLTLNGGTLGGNLSGNGSVVVDGDVSSAKTIANAVTINSSKKLTNTGTISGVVTNKGTFDVTAGSVTGNIANSSTLNVSGGSVKLVTNTGTMNVTDVSALIDDITNTSGTVNLNTDGTLATGSTVAGGTINVKANITSNAGDVAGDTNVIDSGKKLTLNGGTLGGNLSGDGEVVVDGEVSSAKTIANVVTIIASKKLTNTGTISRAVTNNGTFGVTGGSVTGKVTNNLTMNVSGGEVSGGIDNVSTGTVTVSGGEVKTEAVTNAGTFNVTGGTVSSAVTNNATMTVSGGEVSGDVANNTTGILTISSAGKVHKVTNGGTFTTTANGITGGVKNTATLELTGGDLGCNITDETTPTGTTTVSGTVTNTNKKSITQVGLTISETTGSLTTDVDKLTIANGISNNGTLTLTGDGASPDTLEEAVTGTGTTVFGDGNANMTITANSSVSTAMIVTAKTTLAIGADNVDGAVANSGTVKLNGTEATLEKVISGTGNVIVDGTVKSALGKLTNTGNLTVNEGKVLELTEGTLVRNIAGAGTVKLGGGIIVRTNQSIEGILDGNSQTLTMTGGASSVINTLTVGTLTGTTNLNLDVDMSNFTSDKLAVGTMNGTVNVSSINIVKDISADFLAGTEEENTSGLPFTKDNAITFVSNKEGTGAVASGGTYKVNNDAAGQIVLTNNYKYTFEKGTTGGTLKYTVEAVDLTFKKFMEGTLAGYENDPATLSLTGDLANTGTGSNAITVGDNQSNDAINVNLNGHNLTSAAESKIIINSGKTVNLNGGSDSAGTVDAKTDLSVAGILAVDGKINLAGDITNTGAVTFAGTTEATGTLGGAGSYTNTGTMTIEDAAKLQMTGANGLANSGILNLGKTENTVLGANITGNGTMNIMGEVTSAKTITNKVVLTEGKTLTNNGIISGTVTNNGTFAITDGSVTGGISNTDSGTLNVSGGTISTGAVANAGTFNITGGTVSSAVTNNATMNVSGGEVTGVITNNADGTLTISGTGKVHKVTNTGTMEVNYVAGLLDDITNTNGTVNLNAEGTLATGSTITGGTLNVKANITADAGDIAGGTNVVDSGKTLNLISGTLAGTVSGAGNLTIAADKTVTADADKIQTTGTNTVAGTLNLVGATGTGKTLSQALTGTGKTVVHGGSEGSVYTVNADAAISTSGGGNIGIEVESYNKLVINGNNLKVNAQVDANGELELKGGTVTGYIINGNGSTVAAPVGTLSLTEGVKMVVGTDSTETAGVNNISIGTVNVSSSDIVSNLYFAEDLPADKVKIGILNVNDKGEVTIDAGLLMETTYDNGKLKFGDRITTNIGETNVTGTGVINVRLPENTTYTLNELEKIRKEWFGASSADVPYLQFAGVNVKAVFNEELLQAGKENVVVNVPTVSQGEGNLTATIEGQQLKMASDNIVQHGIPVEEAKNQNVLILDNLGATLNEAFKQVTDIVLTNADVLGAKGIIVHENDGKAVNIKMNGNSKMSLFGADGLVLGMNVNRSNLLEQKADLFFAPGEGVGGVLTIPVMMLMGESKIVLNTVQGNGRIFVDPSYLQVNDVNGDASETLVSQIDAATDGSVVNIGNIVDSSTTAYSITELKNAVLYEDLDTGIAENDLSITADKICLKNTVMDKSFGMMALKGHVKMGETGRLAVTSETDMANITSEKIYLNGKGALLVVDSSIAFNDGDCVDDVEIFKANPANAGFVPNVAVVGVDGDNAVKIDKDNAKLFLTGIEEKGVGIYAIMQGTGIDGTQYFDVENDMVMQDGGDTYRIVELDEQEQADLNAYLGGSSTEKIYAVRVDWNKVEKIFTGGPINGQEAWNNMLQNDDKHTPGKEWLLKVIKGTKQDRETGRSALNQVASLSEDLGVARGAYDVSRMTDTAISDHLSLKDWTAKEDKNDNVWASFTHNKEKVDGMGLHGMNTKYDAQYNGTSVGYDLVDDQDITLGVALHYAEGNTTNNFGGHNDSTHTGISIYGQKKLGKFVVQGDVNYLHGSNDLSQNVFGTQITGKAKTNTVSVGFDVRRPIKVNKGYVTPFAGMKYLHIDNKAFHDNLGFNHDGNILNTWVLPVGVEYRTKIENFYGWSVEPALSAGYLFNMGDKSGVKDLTYKGVTDSFGYDVVDNNSLFVKAAVNFGKKHVTVGVGYDFMKSSNSHNNKWNVNLNYAF